MEKIKNKFDNAVMLMDKYKNRTEDLNSDNDTLLDVYGLFKQATCGNCNISQPPIYDFKNTAKYNVWLKFKDENKEYVMKLYTLKVNKILEKANKI